jgi:hypothetical protein
MSARFHAVFFAATTVAVVLAVAWGFYLVGSPTTRRLERFDEQRLQDLQTIAREIHALVVDREDERKLKQPLPRSLAEAANRALDERLNARDPETGEPYGYTVKDDTTYEVCATFSRARDRDSPVFWNHPQGRHCFTINVLDPPPY